MRLLEGGEDGAEGEVGAVPPVLLRLVVAQLLLVLAQLLLLLLRLVLAQLLLPLLLRLLQPLAQIPRAVLRILALDQVTTKLTMFSIDWKSPLPHARRA